MLITDSPSNYIVPLEEFENVGRAWLMPTDQLVPVKVMLSAEDSKHKSPLGNTQKHHFIQYQSPDDPALIAILCLKVSTFYQHVFKQLTTTHFTNQSINYDTDTSTSYLRYSL